MHYKRNVKCQKEFFVFAGTSPFLSVPTERLYWHGYVESIYAMELFKHSVFLKFVAFLITAHQMAHFLNPFFLHLRSKWANHVVNILYIIMTSQQNSNFLRRMTIGNFFKICSIKFVFILSKIFF